MKQYYETVQKQQNEYIASLKRTDPAFSQTNADSAVLYPNTVSSNPSGMTVYNTQQQTVDHSNYQEQYQIPATDMSGVQYQTPASIAGTDADAQTVATYQLVTTPTPAPVVNQLQGHETHEDIHKYKPQGQQEKETKKPKEQSLKPDIPKLEDKTKSNYEIDKVFGMNQKLSKEYSVLLNRKEGQPDDDATNEKTETESKHLDDKHFSRNKKKKKFRENTGGTDFPENMSVNEKKTLKPVASGDGRCDSCGEDFDEEIMKEGDRSAVDTDDNGNIINKSQRSKTYTKKDGNKGINKNLVAQVLDKKTSSNARKTKGNFHVEKDNINLLRTHNINVYPKYDDRLDKDQTFSRHPQDENSHSDINESGSGSGTAGEIENAFSEDLEELSFLTGLNFDESDYDIADALSEELVKQNKGKGK